MKKIIYTIALLSCFILPVSCLTTLGPLVISKNVITEDRITGIWQYDKGTVEIHRMDDKSIKDDDNNFELYRDAIDQLRISPQVNAGKDFVDSNFYKKNYMISFEKNGVGYNMRGALTRIHNDLFIELSPILANDPENLAGSGYDFIYNYLPTFTIAKLIIKGNQSLDIQFLNGDFIKEQIEAGNMLIKHEKDRLFDTFLITASSNELSQFFEKYGTNDRLFSPKNSITLNRKGNP
jgi:hypothetical protein